MQTRREPELKVGVGVGDGTICSKCNHSLKNHTFEIPDKNGIPTNEPIRAKCSHCDCAGQLSADQIPTQ